MKKLCSFAVLFGSGLIGVLSLWPTLDGSIALIQAGNPEAAPSQALLRPLLLLQPALLLSLATGAGAAFAPRLALRSILVEHVNGHAHPWPASTRLLSAAAGGVIGCAALLAGDLLFAALDPAAFARRRVAPADWAAALLTSALYGGLTEEIITRWELMSAIAWGLTKMGLPRSAAIRAALALSALLFAAGHVPALIAVLGDPGPLVVVRTLVLNTVAGVIFGWLFWRRDLETAMPAHAATHLKLFVARLAGVAS